MPIKSDKWIRRMCEEHRMIEPFETGQVRDGKISYGLSSYGYDIRVSSEFKVFTNVHNSIVDPKNFDDRSFVDISGPVCYLTLEISNTTPLPAKVYGGVGIAQLLFFEGDEEPEIAYADRKGKYMKQHGVTLPKL